MADGHVALLELASGPEDGRIYPISSPMFTVGPVAGALVSLDYDPQIGHEGVAIRLEEATVRVGAETYRLGQLFRVGQVWVRVLPVPQEEQR